MCVGLQPDYNSQMLELGIKTLLSYLLGSLIGSLIVGRLRGGVDIRKLGSGNPGGTNALRTQGPVFAIWVILIDAGKGWLAAAVVPAHADPAISHRPGGRAPADAVYGHRARAQDQRDPERLLERQRAAAPTRERRCRSLL